MPRPSIFISHRWDYNYDYYSFTAKLAEYGFPYHDFSVPEHDPLNASRVREIERLLAEQVARSNYFIIFARMASGNSRWCEHEVLTAIGYQRPILAVRPHGYQGNIPTFISSADNQGGPVGFNTPAIIRKMRETLDWWT